MVARDEQIANRIIVQLKQGHLNVNVLTCLSFAEDTEQFFGGSRCKAAVPVESTVLPYFATNSARTKHCESLAAAGLSVGKDAHIEAIDGRCDEKAGVAKDVLLGIPIAGRATEYLVEFPALGICRRGTSLVWVNSHDARPLILLGQYRLALAVRLGGAQRAYAHVDPDPTLEIFQLVVQGLSTFGFGVQGSVQTLIDARQYLGLGDELVHSS
mmetsp:Transcript_4353/g.12282  ORF Transcript_4353/g.12282 Transcript_4353/m.12282 type:complete len:213 (-) Transcript_4353:2432-3070(-)